ncbi:MAG: hypothetical protein NT062_05850 [Proteobacteria bacterium]|nr:hypothetical protein [Pseudomonadota bacterium]
MTRAYLVFLIFLPIFLPILLLSACSKSEPPAPELTCKIAVSTSAAIGTVDAKIVDMSIRQCELEKWQLALKQCIHDAPAGAELQTACFAKFAKRGR